MYYFVFSSGNSRGFHSKSYMEGINFDLIKELAPNARRFWTHEGTSCRLTEYFKLIESDLDDALIYEIDDDEAVLLKMEQDKLVLKGSYSYWYTPMLRYIFKDLDSKKLDPVAIQIKLTGDVVNQDERELASQSYRFTSLNRALPKFMREVNAAKDVLSPELFKAFNDAQNMFVKEIDDFRNAKKKAKAEANKLKNSLKGKLQRHAVYKASN